ncbi:hypothetical protein ACFL43_00310 [Thermodesulfobacteriota bacterium]
MTKSTKKKPDKKIIWQKTAFIPWTAFAIAAILLIIQHGIDYSHNPDMSHKDYLINNWIADERQDIEKYDAGIDQAKADAHLSGTVANNLQDIISYYQLYNQSDNNYVCRHRAIRIVAEHLLLNGDDEICLVTGFLESSKGMTFMPSEYNTGSGHVWIEYQGKEYDYIKEGGFSLKIPLAKRCYTRYSLGPTILNHDGFDQLYEIYIKEVANMSVIS